jgi:hypothetical protein
MATGGAMTHSLLGWWVFDPERPAILRETTGQIVRYAGRAGGALPNLAESANRIWMRFDYEDSETRFPVLIEWRNVPFAAGWRPLVWRVDYGRSAMLWRREANTDRAHPPYGLWRRVDDCLTDALACWPAHPQTGAQPKFIGFNAGWLNGAWTRNLYRSVWGSDGAWIGSPAFRTPYMEALTTPAPAAWSLVTGAGAAEAFDVGPGLTTLQRAIWAHACAGVQRQPYLTTRDHSRILIAQVSTDAEFRLKGTRRFLYADRDIFNDTMHVGVQEVTSHRSPQWTEYAAKDTPFGLVERGTSARFVSSADEQAPRDGFASRVDFVPYAIVRRLAQACLDAWLAFPDAPWMSAGAPDAAEAIGASPATMMIVDWELGGSSKPSRLEAASSLQDPLHDRPNHLRDLFDEENDGLIRATTAFASDGCWSFDPESRTLVNELSGQHVTFQGSVEDNGVATAASLGGEKRYRFRYEDREARYPLLVSVQATTFSGNAHYEWLIDHEASRAEWRQLGTGRDIPLFGLWQRVNEGATDALMCWPEIELTGPRPDRVVSVGGWLNGAWFARVRRRRDRGLDHGLVAHPTLARPVLPKLNAPAPLWHFVDAPRATRNAYLAHVRKIGTGWLYLPAGEKLTGFEADVPHLRRDDGKAVMFPAGLASTLHRGEDYDPGAFFLYADDEVFFCFKGSSSTAYEKWGGSWTFEQTWPSRIGLRDKERFDATVADGIPADLFMRGKVFSNIDQLIPSPALSLKFSDALMDAWMAWAGTTHRLLDDPEQLRKLAATASVPPLEQSGIDLGRKAEVHIEGGYVGGRYNSTVRSKVWMDGA